MYQSCQVQSLLHKSSVASPPLSKDELNPLWNIILSLIIAQREQKLEHIFVFLFSFFVCVCYHRVNLLQLRVNLDNLLVFYIKLRVIPENFRVFSYPTRIKKAPSQILGDLTFILQSRHKLSGHQHYRKAVIYNRLG